METYESPVTEAPVDPTPPDESVSATPDDEEDDDNTAADAASLPEVAPPREELRYPLAFDANGNPVKVPAQARAWRVRRGGGKRGRPRNVFDATTGRQLEIPLGASIDDLIATNVPSDRYLLYPVDGEGAIIPGIIAVTEVPISDEDDDDEDRQEGATVADKDPALAALLGQQETIKGQHEVIKAQSEYLARALASAVSGYAPVRPVAPPPPSPPVMMEPNAPAPAPDSGGLLASLANVKPEQVMGLFMVVKQAFEMFKGMSGGGMPGVGGAP